jgi:hypothetical protein
VSAVVEAIPERVCAVVYLAAFLLPPVGRHTRTRWRQVTRPSMRSPPR